MNKNQNGVCNERYSNLAFFCILHMSSFLIEIHSRIFIAISSWHIYMFWIFNIYFYFHILKWLRTMMIYCCALITILAINFEGFQEVIHLYFWEEALSAVIIQIFATTIKISLCDLVTFCIYSTRANNQIAWRLE